MAELLADDRGITIELDDDKGEIWFAWSPDTDEQILEDAHQLIEDFGYVWVVDSYWDATWERYVYTLKEQVDE